MIKLDLNFHEKLNIEILSTLKSRKINTIQEFLAERVDKICLFTKLSHKDVLNIKQKFIVLFGGEVYSAIELIKIENKKIVTHILCLDDLLQGGLELGQIYEICGSAGSGKTQMCFAITASLATKPNSIVHYIDTKGDFCASRIESMLKTFNGTDKILDRIKVYLVRSTKELFKVLKYIKQVLNEDKNQEIVRLLIIDSVPGIIFKYSKDCEATFILNQLSNICRSIANRYHLPIITTNLISQWVPSLHPEVTSREESSPNSIYPTLGKYWTHVPNTRLLMKKIDKEQRKIIVWKSFLLKTQTECTVSINETGVVSIL
ncbi:DNA repair protein RAD51 homolog 4 isoform X2 [Prorops nasuta]|uniref:DNA repair protein RAD51 homolog 4 isoform X2 n=1 Tax=Prorops nasuta TaxID=863751 RepID=UPI0034CE4056